MSDQQKNNASNADIKAQAVVVSLTVLVFSAIYWSIQIQGVLEMLELAYG